VIRESAKTNSKTIARDAERARRRQLEEAINRIPKREKPRQFRLAAEEWLESKTALTPLGLRYYRQYVAKLSGRFGNRLLTDIGLDDVLALQRERQDQGLSGRQINAEVGTLRTMLTHFGLWAPMWRRFKMLTQRKDTGRAFDPQDERKLIAAVGQSRSPALYPFFVLNLDAGLRPSEARALKRRNLNLTWKDLLVVEGEVIVGQSKTEAGEGRVIPLTRRACAALSLWLTRFPDATPESYVFPFHHVAVAGNERRRWIYGVALDRPMSPSGCRRAFESARKQVGLDYRLYDARHTFVTRLAENPAVSEETIRQLAGHVSSKMLSRYAHIRAQARRAAIASLEPTAEAVKTADFDGARAQNWAHSADPDEPLLN
ncbi:MAG TPA: site-specific integrase, partial [Candidatus Binataceae bacterium]